MVLTELGRKLFRVTSRIFGLVSEADDLVATEEALKEGYLKGILPGPVGR